MRKVESMRCSISSCVEEGREHAVFNIFLCCYSMSLLNLHLQPHSSFFTRCTQNNAPVIRNLYIVSATVSHNSASLGIQLNDDPAIIRRTANYHPCIWDYDFVQSLKSDYTCEKCNWHAEKLKDKVRNIIIDEDTEWLTRLELINSLQRLGLGYLFKKDIKRVLDTIGIVENISTTEGLHAVALHFRLLRQHGYEISQDVFDGFKNKMTGTFKASLCEDNRGMLSLYEASYMAIEGENNLEEAKAFTSWHLTKVEKSVKAKLGKQITHSLELPFNLRVLRPEARWYIEECVIHGGTNPDLLDLAKLDFNMVQAIHQSDLREISRWWRILGLGSKLSFARDRSVENFLWTIGVAPHPQFDGCRRGLAKVNALITTIDDVYDVYGSLDELKLFTEAVERWDIGAIERLPQYMKICFLALYNTVNELAYDTLKDQGFNMVPYVHKAWADLCKAYLVEAKWYYNKYTPTMEKYLNNAWVSISGNVILVHAYFLVEKGITKKGADSLLKSYPNIIRWSSMILRLCNDLATSTAELERGDVPKAIQCYMHETGVSEEIARRHIRHLISEAWGKMNKEQIDAPFSQAYREIAANLGRMAQFMYENEDGHGIPNGKTKNHVMSLLVEPIF